MVVVTVAATPPTSLSCSSSVFSTFPVQSQLSAKHLSSSFTHLTFYKIFLSNSTRRPTSSCRGSTKSKFTTNGTLSIRAYMENSNSLSGFVSKVIGSLPVIGLIARIVSDEGGVGGDIIDFAEFRRRVGNNCNINDSRALFEFKDRRGRAGDPLYVLLCCWLAAVGAGLLKSEEILEGVARLRLSNDIEFEEQTFIAMMNEARERRAKMKGTPPTIGMEIRAEKALEAIYVCCFGRDPIEEEDERLLNVILNAVFPSVGEVKVRQIVRDRVEKVREGGQEYDVSDEKPLPKEAVDRQMKDLQFLKQNSPELLERRSESS